MTMSDRCLAKEMVKMPYELQHAIMQHIMRNDVDRVGNIAKLLNKYRGENNQ